MDDEARRLAGKAGQLAHELSGLTFEAAMNDPRLDELVVEAAIGRLDTERMERLAAALGVPVSMARARVDAWIETLVASRAEV